MGILITVIICATIGALFFSGKVSININIKHTHTTEISESFKEYQKLLIEHNKVEEADDKDKEVTYDDVVGIVRQMWEGVDEDD